jgi:hypothetical protein
VRRDLGLDLPLPQQFVRFFSHALQGDFGLSIRSKRPVSTEIAERFGPTFWPDARGDGLVGAARAWCWASSRPSGATAGPTGSA